MCRLKNPCKIYNYNKPNGITLYFLQLNSFNELLIQTLCRVNVTRVFVKQLGVGLLKNFYHKLKVGKLKNGGEWEAVINWWKQWILGDDEIMKLIRDRIRRIYTENIK